MDDTNEWHVVQRKKKEPKNNANNMSPIFRPSSKLPRPGLPDGRPQGLTDGRPQGLPKSDIKNKHHIENNLRPNVKEVIEPKEIVENPQIEIPFEISGDGSNIPLRCEYVLWVHSVQNNDWSIAGYQKLCTIRNISDFWKLFNNINKLNFKNNNFFLMKHIVNPIWEDESNRNGGICSLRIEMDHALKVYELLCIFLMCEKLVADIDDINGISITPKNNWAILKIWNRDKTNKLDKLLHKGILDKYKNVSIQYKQNQPEY
jgi:hypothetical protein